MNKKELIDKISEVSGVYKKDVTSVIDAFSQTITESLINGEPVHMVGFGAFELRERSARTARNPRTGEVVQVEAYKTPVFKVGKPFKDAVKNA